MIPEIDKGDYLTFASIGRALGLKYDVAKCEVSPGVWRRHPDLLPAESRSDISRDGYIGVLFLLARMEDREEANRWLDRIIKAGWRRRWTMGDRGNFDYVNIWPLIPYIYALRYGKWIPTPPILIWGKAKTGYRAHLAAMMIMIDLEMGKPYSKHQTAISALLDNNRNSEWFLALAGFGGREESYDWGGCPVLTYRLLVMCAREHYRKG